MWIISLELKKNKGNEAIMEALREWFMKEYPDVEPSAYPIPLQS